MNIEVIIRGMRTVGMILCPEHAEQIPRPDGKVITHAFTNRICQVCERDKFAREVLRYRTAPPPDRSYA